MATLVTLPARDTVGNNQEGWRIDRQSPARPRQITNPLNSAETIGLDYYTVSVQQGSRFNNVYATVRVPVAYIVTSRRIQAALVQSAQERRVVDIGPLAGRNLRSISPSGWQIIGANSRY